MSKKSELQLEKEKAASLDKYYTKVEVAHHCYEIMKQFVPEGSVYIEPSAGGGAFLRAVDDDIFGFDIAPDAPEIIQMDFTTGDPASVLPQEFRARNLVCIGNPPFGKKGILATRFLDRALDKFGVVGFIVPIQFRKWSIQSKISALEARLLIDETLPEESFEHLGKPYSLRCCFQLWSVKHPDLPDLKIATKPKTDHPDFKMWQFNRTEEAEKYFDYNWDFAVPRQGYQDYTFKAYNKDECDRKKQWIFFKANTDEVLTSLLALDFVKLSEKNTGIPGFGKADVVEAYEKYCRREYG